jgi:hypothetical protein
MTREELKNLNDEQLQQLLADVQSEIESRKQVLVFKLEGKALKPASYAQIKFAEKLGIEIKTSASQILKRMEMFDMSRAIKAAKSGKRVIITN